MRVGVRKRDREGENENEAKMPSKKYGSGSVLLMLIFTVL